MHLFIRSLLPDCSNRIDMSRLLYRRLLQLRVIAFTLSAVVTFDCTAIESSLKSCLVTQIPENQQILNSQGFKTSWDTMSVIHS